MRMTAPRASARRPRTSSSLAMDSSASASRVCRVLQRERSAASTPGTAFLYRSASRSSRNLREGHMSG